MRYIDLRSDTVTQPTQAMREAMFHAEVGDEGFRDDPTVRKLEELAARMLGKEEALFVTSGTQGNGVSLMAHTQRGEAIICAPDCHIITHEAGAYAVLSGVSPCFARLGKDGVIEPDSVQELLADNSGLQVARTGAVCLENALSNGGVIPLETMQKVYEAAHSKGVPVHLDGARLFNAAAALGVEAAQITRFCDSVSCCLSKGLCAPVGSVVAGSREFIHKARKSRQLLGGGLRQAGFLAAAGIVALTEMTGRLKEDHENAAYLAKRLAELPGIHVRMERVKINLLFYTVDWPAALREAYPARMLERGIKITPFSDGEFRMVTNYGVTRADCDAVAEAVREIAAEFEG